MSLDLAFKALLAAPDATVIIDESGTILFSSRQTAAMFGYGENIIGMGIEQLLPESFRARHASHRQHFFASGRARSMGAGLDLKARRQDGSEFAVEISLSPLEDEGRLLVAAAIRDVTERKRVEAEMGYLESIAHTALASDSTEALIKALLTRVRTALRSDTATILLADTEGNYLVPLASDGMEAEVGGELQVPIGHGVAGQIALSDGAVIIDDMSKVDVVSPILRSRVRSLVGIALRSGGRLIGVMHAGAVTARAFTKDDARLLSLAADRISLAIERMRLQESEHTARQAAEAANRQKSSFLSTASHDLRQPLQALSLLNGSLRRLITDEGDIADALIAQEAAIDAMSRLLNALLDISKLESGAIKPNPADFVVTEIFDELRREFTGLAQNKGLLLQVTCGAESIHSDAALVGQILRNLLINAVKYTRAGSVTLRCLREAGHVRLEVIDTGIGIAADQLQHIYDEFYQVGVPTNTTREGYGLGLSIVRRIATLLDAKLDVQSRVGQGSVFALTLPAGSANVGQSRSAASPRVRPVQSRARVLLVEDDLAVRNATRLLLKSEGFEVMAAFSLDDALEQIVGRPSMDLLVTDYHLQDGKTGVDVIAAVRSALDCQLKAVLITGDTSSAVAGLSQDDSMRVVSKPINAEHLMSVLKALLVA